MVNNSLKGIIAASFVSLALSGCEESENVPPEGQKPKIPVFTLLSPDSTNVDFQNKLVEGLNANVLVYEYLYNGGGVAAGDFNDDGLIDIYFTSNMDANHFYLNQGEMKFKDITETSQTSGRQGPWKTGISAADINGDGRLDLYLCYSGALPPDKRKNQLFINQGNDENGIPIFDEQAKEYGLDSPAFSNQGYFFDYDHDGDLDMLLLNHNPKSLPVLNEASTKASLKIDDPLQGIRLFRQNDGKFEDVTINAGISGSALTYGLGIGISDLNDDGWSDFYVSNDYTIPDYLYINNQDGTFSDKLSEQLGHTSHFSMGNDIADINNDGWPDIFTLDMLPEDNRRQKLLLAPDNYEKFELNLRSGFHHQYMRNMLQLNNGNGTFSEIGQLAGISNTDWSWAPLFADYDNDGLKDLYVTNGYFRDYTNLDFINYMDDYVKSKGRLKREDVLEIIKQMPSSNLTNYYFSNNGGITFSDNTEEFGFDQASNSNGAAYADLDNDGDLDLIVNNINKFASIYRNETNKKNTNYLQITLKGIDGNTRGIGSKVTLYAQGKQQCLEQLPTRGYLSTVSTTLQFGLGKAEKIDSLKIRWNNGKEQLLRDIGLNQMLVLDENEASRTAASTEKPNPLLKEIQSPINHKNTGATVNDFKRQSLLIYQPSHSGPCSAKGDINNDGLEDVFIGGTKGQAAALYVQRPDQRFSRLSIESFESDKEHHDADAVIFDADNDGNLDIYVGSGGYHDFTTNDALLQDRLYFGDGIGNFSKNELALPKNPVSTGCIAVEDINADGAIDLFIGGRIVPGMYPTSPKSQLLINDGDGKFSEQTEKFAPGLIESGMITDAVWSDINQDGRKDLVVVGEWMPISIYLNTGDRLVDKTEDFFNRRYQGWWNTLTVDDLNRDGRPDIVAGNMGTNTQFKVSDSKPATLLFRDFDFNESIDPLFSFFINGRSYPYITRDELLGQLAGKRSDFNTYESYAEATVEDILSKEEINAAKKLTANHLETSLFLSTTKGKYEIAPLPVECQFAPVYTVSMADFNGDTVKDLLFFGNNDYFKLRLGKFDANYGTLVLGNGEGGFEYIDQTISGLDVRGSVHSSLLIDNRLFLGIYEKPIKAYEFAPTNTGN